MNALARAASVAAALTLGGSAAFAQSSGPDGGRFEASIGAVRIGRASFDSREAVETISSGGTFRLFSSTSELTAGVGWAARIGVKVMRRLDVEASGTYSTPDLRTRIESDVETSNAPLVAAVAVQQFTLGGAALWYPPAPRIASRVALFARGGIGLERHLEDRGTRVVDGGMLEAGGGAKYLAASRPHGWWKGIGARFDVLALVRTSDVTLDERAHVSPAMAASVFVRF